MVTVTGLVGKLVWAWTPRAVRPRTMLATARRRLIKVFVVVSSIGWTDELKESGGVWLLHGRRFLKGV